MKRKITKKNFLYNYTDRNVTDTILNSPFTTEEIVKGTTLVILSVMK